VAAYVNDPLVSLKAPPARTGAELLAAMEPIARRPRGWTCPSTCSTAMPTALPIRQGSREIHACWGGADKTLRLWPGSRHETLNDLDREAVAAELLDWVRARCGRGGK
jgi:acylglycerol lipase